MVPSVFEKEEFFKPEATSRYKSRGDRVFEDEESVDEHNSERSEDKEARDTFTRLKMQKLFLEKEMT